MRKIKQWLSTLATVFFCAVCLLPAIVVALAFAADNDIALMACQYEEDTP